jgi:hypothetical protein
MSLIKHSCPNCNTDLEIPEQVERVCCRRCGNHFLIEIFQDVVSLKRVKEKRSGLNTDSALNEILRGDMGENIDLLDKQIHLLNRQLAQSRTSAFSSLSVSALFFFFSLVWLLAERDLMALFCGTIAVTMALVAGMCLRKSARLRSSLTLLISRRDQIARRMRPNMPRIF